MTNPDWRSRKSAIADLCLRYGPLIRNLPQGLDGPTLMLAIALNESIGQKDGMLYYPPRHEPAYDAGGKYCKGEQAELVKEYGAIAASSIGPWQVMACNAKGFKPTELTDTDKCAHAFLGFINRELARQKPLNLRAVGDMYNSGNWRDLIVPAEYCIRLQANYERAKGEVPPTLGWVDE